MYFWRRAPANSYEKTASLVLLVCVAALPLALAADTVVEEIIARINN